MNRLPNLETRLCDYIEFIENINGFKAPNHVSLCAALITRLLVVLAGRSAQFTKSYGCETSWEKRTNDGGVCRRQFMDECP